MKFLALFLTFLVLAYASKIDDKVINDLSMKGGRSNIMINLNEQVKYTEKDFEVLDKMEWEKRGFLVMNQLKSLAEKTQKNLIRYLQNNGIEFDTFYVQNSIAAYNVAEKNVHEISQMNDVKRVFSNEVITQDMPEVTKYVDEKSVAPEWNLDWVNATKLWSLGFNGNGTVVGGADTGIDYLHPNINSNYRGKTSSGYNHNYNWADGVTNRTFPQCRSPCGCSLQVPCDDQNHGTHTVSTAVGSKDRITGVSPGSKWIGCRAFSDMGRHWMSSTFITCLQFFLAPTNLNGQQPNPSLRPHTTIHSYGCNQFLGCPNHNDMEPSAIALRAAGVVMSVAAQNAGPSCGSVNRQPAHYASIISVGALGVKTDLIAGFSSRGPVTIDGSQRRKPDLSAPGSSILGAVLRGGYGQMSGTSMAAPHVAGAIALFWSAIPKLKGNIGETLKFFEKTAKHQKSRDCQSSQESPNNVYGYGTINIYGAYLEAKKMGY